MRIIHAIWALNTGGAESMLVDIINEQSKKHNVHLIIVNRSESKALAGAISDRVTVHRFGRKPGSRNIFLALLKNIKLIAINADVVHCHNHDLVHYFMLAKKMGYKFCLTIHCVDQSIQYNDKYLKLFAISEIVKNDVYSRSNRSPIVISNGVPRGKLSIKSSHESQKTPFKIVQIGRLDHHLKGQDISLHAIGCLIDEKNVENILLDFIGDGSSEENLLQLAGELGVSHCCNFIGLKDRHWIYNHLCDYDLLIQPSRQEGFGLTIVEALASKVPVLVSDIEGPMEIIDNGRYGYYFKSEVYSDMCDKILKIMKEYGDQAFLTKIEDGYRHFEDIYDVRNTALAYIKSYNDS